MLYSKTRQQSQFDLQEMREKVMLQFQKNQYALDQLTQSCKSVVDTFRQVEIFQGHISGIPQEYIADDFSSVKKLQEDMNFCQPENIQEQTEEKENKYIKRVLLTMFPTIAVLGSPVIAQRNKKISIENCKEIMQLKEKYNEMQQQEILIKSKTKEIKALHLKVFQYLKKLQVTKISNYQDFQPDQKSDFKTMMLHVKALRKELGE